ncbi:MAG TPA: hypothetical protein VFV38_00360 [Ktedonobacteraceae bacterium]|nr:hypothetical protein [Ktedonobacteraceae bacterium]
MLYQALSKLNYHAQMNVFLRLLKHSKVGAFLIHGAADHGQRWLLNRLMGHAIRTSDDLVLPISFGYWDRRDLSVILQKIGERLNLRRNSSLQEIIEHLHACWQKRSVILIFRDAGDVPPPLLRDLKEQFWDVLVQRTRRGPSPQEQARLLLFLVDEAGNVGEWPFSCAEQPDASWSPDVPVKPPMITPIGVADLTTWMQIVCEDLPAKIRDTPAQIIWQQAREGIPQLVLEHLCELGNCEWLEMEHVWMKY